MIHERSKKNNFFYKIKFKLSVLLKSVNMWGHSKLTVMFVPHSEKKIFNFQISIYTIIFSITLILILITTSIFAIKSQKDTFKKKEIFQTENISISNKLNNFIEITRQLESYQNELQNMLINLIKVSGSAQTNIKDFINIDLIKENKTELIESLKKSNEEITTSFVDEIFILDKIIIKINKFHSKLISVENQIKGFKSVMQNIPSIWPVFGGVGIFASSFGMRIDPFTRQLSFHRGVDILAMPGTPVRATADGIVSAAEFHDGNGLYININHKYGYVSNYSHLQRFIVKTGDFVKKGQIIGYIGNTGRSTGYHLHYEIRSYGEPIDPVQFFYLDNFYR